MTSTPIKPVLIGSQVLQRGLMVYEMGHELQELAATLAKVHKGKPIRTILAQFPKNGLSIGKGGGGRSILRIKKGYQQGSRHRAGLR